MSNNTTSGSVSVPKPLADEFEVVKDNACRICTEVIGESREGGTVEEPTTTKCGHSFGADCLEHWLQEKTTCPMCRTVLKDAAVAPPVRTPFVPISASWSLRYTGLSLATNPPVPLEDRAEHDRLLSRARAAMIEGQMRRHDMAARIRAASTRTRGAEDMSNTLDAWQAVMQAYHTRLRAELDRREEIDREGSDVLFGDAESEHGNDGEGN